ncbi:hypothetical protein ABDK56_07615 [Sphingomonas sp. ASV193]|uniref:hypothetical protein n=1 Tax=Sphingomonas sp. ASV193 TaxID=3144405 RepID=UPI0032E8F4CB
MPYRRAPWFVGLTVAVILVGFWPSYFGAVGRVPWQFHVHGIAASLWVAMVLAQSILIGKAQLPLHRAIGTASLFLFPFLIGGLFAIVDYSGKSFSRSHDPVETMLGGAFATGMLIAAAAYVTVFFRALKYRRKVWVHAGYMLSTPLILFESPFSRVLGMFVPGFVVTGPATFDRILPGIVWSMALELLFVAWLWFRFRERARPFLVTGAFIAVQMVVMTMAAGSRLFDPLLLAIGAAPSAAVVAVGMAIGAGASWLGWRAGRRDKRLVSVAA